MTTDWDSFINDLANEPIPAATKKDNTQKFPCPTCAGTGRYQGARVHQEKSHCFACRGLGYFKTDPRKLKEQRQKAAQKKAAEVSAFILEHRALIEALASVADWNTFAIEMLNQLGIGPATVDPLFIPRRIRDIEAGFNFRGGKVLSPNQIAACERMLAKIAARREAKEAEKAAAPKHTVNLQPIRDMFEAALANGHKRPVYRAEGLVINRAPDHGSNPGALYVKNERDIYGGKVLGIEFSPSRDGQSADFTQHGPAAAALALIASNPLEAAIRYGRKTGKCACCGRELTNKESIELGIGPICRDKWGL